MAEQKYRAIFKTEILPAEGCVVTPDGFSTIEFHHIGSSSLNSYNIDGCPFHNYMYQTPPRVYSSGGFEVIGTSFKITKNEGTDVQGFTIKKYYEPIR